MAMTYHDQVFLAPLARRGKSPDRQPPKFENHGIGRSPRFAPGWWLAGVGLFYAAVALICIVFI